jgi:hypothetical protein
MQISLQFNQPEKIFKIGWYFTPLSKFNCCLIIRYSKLLNGFSISIALPVIKYLFKYIQYTIPNLYWWSRPDTPYDSGLSGWLQSNPKPAGQKY